MSTKKNKKKKIETVYSNPLMVKSHFVLEKLYV